MLLCDLKRDPLHEFCVLLREGAGSDTSITSLGGFRLSVSPWNVETPLDRHTGDNLGDDALVSRALERTADFAPLYERYAMVIYGYCFNLTRDPEIANDLTAQVFIRAIERLHQYRPRAGANFRSWLFAIARNIVIDQWRRRRPMRAIEEVMDIWRADDPGPEEIAVHRAQMNSVLDALDHLPERYRDIVRLRWAGLTTAEISQTLGMSESAMKSAQTRAYRRLRDILEPANGGSQ